MIASESRKPKSQESCLKIFKTLKESNKVKVTSINCCIDIVKEYWRKRDQGLNNSKLLINTIINELQVYDILLY
ncbi:hypothetical protein PACTADRAFT_50863 [Pachysolen tannophilus NRRL Y-2460]|uniref:Uncharacterized protein n=1 Tax=Pachysolen tannophilus NRRL Y-2460 TaxID=669874 RepID=A0A1E4TTG2_PACTA|nr:hypothetical protein PACTADRAFT_50863 [Pachysolen tannophilus NRRL Y-2460]